MLEPRYDFGLVLASGGMYAIGGRTSLGQRLSSVERYDPVKNTWKRRAPLPEPRFGAAVAVVNSIIYVVGGADASGRRTRTVFTYNPDQNTWRAGLPIPAATSGCGGAVAIQRWLFVYSGCENQLWRYDTSTQVWVPLPPPPVQHAYGAVAVRGSRIYLAGGLDRNLPTRKLHVFDSATLRWSAGIFGPASMPEFRYYTSGAFHTNGKFYVMGGRGSDGRPAPTMLIYDPRFTRWSGEPMPRLGPDHMRVLRSGLDLYAVGGQINSTTATSAVLKYRP